MRFCPFEPVTQTAARLGALETRQSLDGVSQFGIHHLAGGRGGAQGGHKVLNDLRVAPYYGLWGVPVYARLRPMIHRSLDFATPKEYSARHV